MMQQDSALNQSASAETHGKTNNQSIRRGFMPLRKFFLAGYYYRILAKFLVPQIERSSINPNWVTIGGLVLAILVPVGFYVHPVFGLLFITLSGIADSIDGVAARACRLHTVFGAFLDSSVDRISDFFYLFGFWILFWGKDKLILASTLIFFSLLLSFMISYVKARAEGLGVICEKGPMERGWRVLYQIGWAFSLCLFPRAFDRILWAGLIIFFVLVLVTVIQRVGYIRSRLKTAEDSR